MSSPARIGIDVMSNEQPLSELLNGGVRALRKYPALKLYVIGDAKAIHANLKSLFYPKERLEIIPSTEVIGMDEDPITAARKKPNSSIVVGLQALKKGTIDGFFSPGNTGAILSAALLYVGRIAGVKRPAIASPMPTSFNQRVSLFLDAGANADCTPEYLQQFAVMGYVYSKHVLRIADPKIGLLNLGEEKNKGNKLAKETYLLLKNLPYPFAGNIEPHAFFNTQADIVVCDGFVGNIFLKCAEALAEQIAGITRAKLRSSLLTKLGAFLLRRQFRSLWREMTASHYGGAPLLGIAKPVFIGHGRSDARSVANAIHIALRTVESQTQNIIKKAISQISTHH